MRGIGTIINVAAVILGGGAGMLLKGGLKERYQQILMQALGVCTIFIGISGALKGMYRIENGVLETSGTMLLIASLVLGSPSGGMDSNRKMDGPFRRVAPGKSGREK